MKDLNSLTERVIGAAIKVHKVLGPGLLESTYETCLQHELVQKGLVVQRQLAQPVRYEGCAIECGYRLDLLVEGLIIVELKAVEKVLPVHEAQLLSYVRLSGCPLGLLINFNTKYLRDGLSRIINDRV